MRRLFDAAPELLQRLSFNGTKRAVASDLVLELQRQEQHYQGVVLDVLVELSQFDDRFLKLARLEDGQAKVRQAQESLGEVKRIVRLYAENVAERERLQKDLAASEKQAALRRSHEQCSSVSGRSS